eukprot:3979044-Pyramimonas_sp.AAC.1
MPIGGSERAMGARCRMGVPVRTGAFLRVRQPAPVPIASPPPNDPPMGTGVLFVRQSSRRNDR